MTSSASGENDTFSMGTGRGMKWDVGCCCRPSLHHFLLVLEDYLSLTSSWCFPGARGSGEIVVKIHEVLQKSIQMPGSGLTRNILSSARG